VSGVIVAAGDIADILMAVAKNLSERSVEDINSAVDIL
jgi:hypothetical protein